MTWLVVASVAAVCVLLRTAGPLLLAGKTLPPQLEARLSRAIPPLLVALVAIQLFAADGSLGIDARAPGALAGGLVFLWRRSMILALLAATLATASFRAVAEGA